MSLPEPGLVGAVADAPVGSYHGAGFRHMAARWDDPLSGEGAHIHGGRFNPPGSFPVVYLCTTRSSAAAELRLRGERLTIGVEGLLPRILYRYEVDLDRLLDLTNKRTLSHLGLTRDQLTGPDLTLPRRIGVEAQTAGLQAVKAPSATGVDDVLAIFRDGVAGLSTSFAERWESIEDL